MRNLNIAELYEDLDDDTDGAKEAVNSGMDSESAALN